MNITITIPAPLRRHTRGAGQLECSVANLPELVRHLELTFSGLKPYLRDEAGELRRFLNFYVNEEDIRFLGNEKYNFQDGDRVMIVPSIAGGSWV